MARPRPAPPSWAWCEGSVWTKASKIAARASGATPGPVSRTEKRRRPFGGADQFGAQQHAADVSVNLMALPA
jgi:hypothetical protein